jgi:uncharacterized membrane protein
MQADKDEEKILLEALEEWRSTGTISPEQAEVMRSSIHPRSTERQQLAQYFFIVAVSSALLAFGALFIDEKLLEQLRRNFLLSNYTISLAAAALAAAGFWYGRHRRRIITPVTYEVYMLPGTLCTFVALVYLCKELGNGEGYTIFTGLTALTFLTLSLAFRSRVLWLACLAAAMGWYGAFSTVFSHNNLFLGMNYPVRFTVFGILVILLSLMQKNIPRMRPMSSLSYHTGLLIFFTGLWGVSVFGNFNTLEAWRIVRQASMLPFAAISCLLTAGGLFLGIHRNDEILRDYSILFLLINLYTRYFEYFWDSLNKGLFFLVLAISFGLLARWLSRTKLEAKS